MSVGAVDLTIQAVFARLEECDTIVVGTFRKPAPTLAHQLVGQLIAIALTAVVGLSACTSDQVIDNTVGVAAGATKVVAKGAVGAGKLAVKGGKALVGNE